MSSISADNIPSSTHTIVITVNQHVMCSFKINSGSGRSVTLSVSIIVVIIAGMTVPVSVICLAFFITGWKLKQWKHSQCWKCYHNLGAYLSTSSEQVDLSLFLQHFENVWFTAMQKIILVFACNSFLSAVVVFSINYEASVWETNTVWHNFIVPVTVRVFSSSWGDPVPLTKC